MADNGENPREMRKQLQREAVDQRAAERRQRKTIRTALGRDEAERTPSETQLLLDHPALVQQRRDEPTVAKQKITELAALLSAARHVVVYTGAGMSTAAGIPDYRGPEGVWTHLQQGHAATPQPQHAMHNLQPTHAHMILAAWAQAGRVQQIVSQNCDGLHLRSGVPQERLSEIHGNCLVEVCRSCQVAQPDSPAAALVWRAFDVTAHTAFRRHDSGRRCPTCHSSLQDTIVHFGEKGNIPGVHNWAAANAQATQADLILCLGTSLKVLKAYAPLWAGLRRKGARRARLVIVNLQWTPKDAVADLTIAAEVDAVLTELATLLPSWPSAVAYTRATDPFLIASVAPLTGEAGAAEGRGWFAQGLRGPKHRRTSSTQSREAADKACAGGDGVDAADRTLNHSSCSREDGREEGDWRRTDDGATSAAALPTGRLQLKPEPSVDHGFA